MTKNEKTKKIAGQDLPASSFAYVGYPDDTSTWKLPLFFPGDLKKTVNHISDALGRFEQTKSIPDEHREMVRHVIVGAAKAHGLKIDDSFRRVTPPIPTVEPSPAELAMQRELKALNDDFTKSEAISDFRADSILKALGLE